MSTKGQNVEEMDDQLMAFAGGFESFEEAQARKEKEEAESGNRPDINYFKMDKFADYDIKVFPHHPESLKAGSKGYSTPVRQAWLNIVKPGADKEINVKVFNAKQCGFSEDLLSTYKYLAVGKLKAEIADAKGKAKEKLEKVLETVDSSGFNGGLRFDFKHLMWILDMQNRDKGLHMFECSNGVFKSLEETKMTIWGKRYKKNKKAPCPVTGVSPDGLSAANIVIIQKLKNGKKTDYKVMLDLEEDMAEFTQEEIKALMAAPKLPSFIYYNKRSFQATMIFLEQYDAKYNLGVFSSDEFVDVVEKLKAEVDAVKDDTSSFDLNSKGKSDGDSDNDTESAEGLKLDDLLDEFDTLVEDGIEDGSDEMNDFRKKLRQYIKQEGISGIKIGRKDATEDVIQKIEDFVEENGERGIVAADDEEEEVADETPANEPDTTEDEEADEDDQEDTDTEDEADEDEEEEEEKPTRRRRSSGSGSRTTRRRRQ